MTRRQPDYFSITSTTGTEVYAASVPTGEIYEQQKNT